MKTSLVYTYWTHILLTSICYFPSRKCLLLINEFISTHFVHIVMTTINKCMSIMLSVRIEMFKSSHNKGCLNEIAAYSMKSHLYFMKFVNTTVPQYDDVMKWKHFPRCFPFVREIHQSPVNFPYKGQKRGVLMFSLICICTNGWVNNLNVDDNRRSHYDATVMNRRSSARLQYLHCRDIRSASNGRVCLLFKCKVAI